MRVEQLPGEDARGPEFGQERMPEGLCLGWRWGMECEGAMKVCKGQFGVRGQAWLELLQSTRAHSYAHACTPAALKIAFGLSNVELCI